MSVDFEFIRSVIPTAFCMGKSCTQLPKLAVDSRKIQPGEMFVAVQGAHVDGHQFIRQAFEQGAVGAMIAAPMQTSLSALIAEYGNTHTFIVVDNPHQAVCTLAAAWRKRFTYPVIGVTGSAGKTTTKEVLGNILRCQGMNVLLSQGTQNTLIGISLNILHMRAEHQAAVFEMGISKRGEMAELARLVMPTMGIITSIGHCHMEGLGSLHDIAAEKREIFKYLPETGVGIIDGDQPFLASISYSHPIIKFGRKMINQVQARKIQHQGDRITFQLKLYENRASVTLVTENSARIFNALAASAAAYVLGVSEEAIYRGVQEPVSVSGRFRKCLLKNSPAILIDDSYNANPESMKAALEAFELMQGSGKKIAVLGDMLELGIHAPFWHRQLGRFLRKIPSLNEVIFIGEQVKYAQKVVPFGLETQWVASWEEALPLVKKRAGEASFILVKGSLGIGLSKLVVRLLHDIS